MKKKHLVLSYLIIFVCIITNTSCNKQDEPDITDNTENNSGNLGKNSEENNEENTDDIIQYYFFVETQVGNVTPNAGSMNIAFDCNQPWTVSYSGNISGFSYTPSRGNGSGRITIKYDAVEYKETSSSVTWNESGTLTFQIREGNSRNFNNTTYKVYIRRFGSKMKV